MSKDEEVRRSQLSEDSPEWQAAFPHLVGDVVTGWPVESCVVSGFLDPGGQPRLGLSLAFYDEERPLVCWLHLGLARELHQTLGEILARYEDLETQAPPGT